MYLFSSRLRSLRKINSITQTELSISLGYSRSTIAKYETGNRLPSGQFLMELADYFEVSLDYLLGRANIKNNNECKNKTKSKFILIINPKDGKIIDCTPSALEFYGYGKQKLLNKTIFELNVLPNEKITNLLHKPKKITDEIYYFKHKIADGTIKDIECEMNLFNIKNSKIIFAIIKEKEDKQIFKIKDQLIESLHELSAQKNPYKLNHAKNIASLSHEIGKHLSLSKKQLSNLKIVSFLQNIGETKLPTYIMNTPNKLISSEFNLIKEHPLYSYNLTKDISFDERVGKIILQHHERIDGTGYPNGLYEREILLESKIIAVADVFCALREKRPHRDSYDLDTAMKIINKMKGKKYNKSIVNTLNHVFYNTNFNLSQ